MSSLAVLILSTYAAALPGSVLFVARYQRPRHRPFCRDGLRYTAVVVSWMSLIVSAVSVLITTTSSRPGFSPFLAFVGTVGLGGIQSANRHSYDKDTPEESDESSTLQHLMTLGIPMALEWLDDRLSTIKEHQIAKWRRQLRGHTAIVGLMERLRVRFNGDASAERHGLVRELDIREDLYFERRGDWVHAQGTERRRLRVRLEIATLSVLGLIYEAHADGVVVPKRVVRPRSSPPPTARSG
jgi:hypothetical protein